jgi:hypothetical protein
MTMADDEDEQSARFLQACLRDPDLGRRRLPAVVGMLEHDDRRTRLAAAWTCCLVAASHPDTVPYIVRRLVDRLDDEATLELTHALDYLADSYPDVVHDVLDEIDEAAAGLDRGSHPLPEAGPFTRNYYYDSTPSRGGSGRVRLPGEGGEGDPRRAYTDDATAHEDPAARNDAPPRAEADRPSSGEDTAGEDSNGASTGDDSSPESNGTPPPMVERTTDVTAIAVRSRFDKLHVLASQRQSRYSTDYDALVGSGAQEEAIALRVLELPSEAGNRPDFEAAAGEHLERWAGVDDHEHVVSLLDWGKAPRPWLATSFAGESLADMPARTPDQALADAISLADAVSYCHRRDVVHAGIDPQNVAYPGDVLDANDQQPPLLNNVGLVALFHTEQNPAELLDPRYAAPEYFERRFGRVDAASDVYGLGAIIYRLYTGEPPARGTFEEVKATVTGPETPVPSDVDGTLPDRIDDVVSKAMATKKLQRYDTVEHLRQDLVGMQEDGTA